MYVISYFFCLQHGLRSRPTYIPGVQPLYDGLDDVGRNKGRTNLGEII